MKRSRTEGIVLHRAEVYTNTDYHFVVNRNGSIKRLVPLDERGEHAKDYNGVTIGVAVFGDFASLEPGLNNFVTEAQMSTTIALLRTLNAMYSNVLWATGHSNLGTKGTDVPQKLTAGHTCPGEAFPLMQIIGAAGLKPFVPPPTLVA